MEDDSGEVRGSDRVEKVDCPRSGVPSVSEAYSNFLEFGAGGQSDWAKHLHV